VRVESVVSERKRLVAQSHPRAIAVVPWTRGMGRYLLLPVDLGCTEKSLAQYLRLDIELALVCCVLVVASAALAEVGAGRRSALGRWRENAIQASPCEPMTILNDRDLGALAGKNERSEDGFAPDVFALDASESVATVHEFFDRQFQMSSPQRHSDYK